MEDKHIPYFAHEADMARMERSNKRLWIAVIIAIILLCVSNAYWLYQWMSFDEVVAEVDVDGGNGNANYIGNDGDFEGDINNGTDTGKN